MSTTPIPLIVLFIALIYVVFRNMSHSKQMKSTGETAPERNGCSGNILFVVLLSFPFIILLLGVDGLTNDPSGEYQSGSILMVLLGLVSPLFLVYRLWQALQLRQKGMGLSQALRTTFRLDFRT